jgi:hypothetical protein
MTSFSGFEMTPNFAGFWGKPFAAALITVVIVYG